MGRCERKMKALGEIQYEIGCGISDFIDMMLLRLKNERTEQKK